MSQPDFPLIVIDHWGYVDLLVDGRAYKKCKLLAYVKGFHKHITGYDRHLNTWKVGEVHSRFGNNQLAWLLANTIYNPMIQVTFAWCKSGTYTLNDLKKQLASLIDRDDDILTQFVEAKELNRRIAAARTFGALVDVLNKDVFVSDL